MISFFFLKEKSIHIAYTSAQAFEGKFINMIFMYTTHDRLNLCVWMKWLYRSVGNWIKIDRHWKFSSQRKYIAYLLCILCVYVFFFIVLALSWLLLLFLLSTRISPISSLPTIFLGFFSFAVLFSLATARYKYIASCSCVCCSVLNISMVVWL